MINRFNQLTRYSVTGPLLLVACVSAYADDIRPPTIPSSVSVTSATTSSISLSWGPSTDDTQLRDYQIYRNSQLVGNATDTHYEDRDLQQGTPYYYWIQATDSAGNQSSTSRWIYTMTVVGASSDSHSEQPVSNGRPTAPTNVTATRDTNGDIQVTWSRPSDGTSVEGYNVYRNNNYINTVFTETYIDDTNSADINAGYTVVTFDDNKNYSSQSQSSTKSSGTSDQFFDDDTGGSTEPSIPDGLRGTALSSSALTLNWNPSRDDGEIRGYNVYRDGAYLTTVSGTLFDDSGLEPGRVYRYSVVAFDEPRNFSSHSSEVLLSTDGGLQTAKPVTTTTNPPSPRNSDSQPSLDGYYLAFSDEFNDAGLDQNKWNTAYLWGPDLVTNEEEQYYVDSNNYPDFGYKPFSGNGEYLSIKVDRTPDYLLDRANGQPFLSGVMTSYDRFQFTYGYAEARVKLPKGNGLFGAFWLLNAYYVDLEPEIDLVELLGENPTTVYHTYHYRDSSGALVSSDSFETSGQDFSNDFHVYAVRWSPNEIVWYIDGVERRRLSHGEVSAQPMYVLFNLAMGGVWPVSSDGSTPIPSTLDIDYVRVYRK